MHLYLPTKTNYNSMFKKDPLPGSKKMLSVNYTDPNNMNHNLQFLENRQVVIDDIQQLNYATYGAGTNFVDATRVLKSKITPKRNPTIVEEKVKKVEAVLWIPSGGLGHCLHNLAWTYRFCLEHHSKLYIYGLNKHIPYQETFEKTLEFLDHRVPYEEVDNIISFFTKYNIHHKYYEMVKNARYNTHVRYMKKDDSVALICSCKGENINKIFNFKNSYVSEVFSNPFKYYKNDYQLVCSGKPKSLDSQVNKKIKQFKISGSYVALFGVTNKMLNIEKEDKQYYGKPKTLVMTYLNNNDERIVYCMKEKSEHKLTDIKTIESCTYGVNDRRLDVTKTVLMKLVSYEVKQPKKVDFGIEEQKKLLGEVLRAKNYIAVHYRGRDKTAEGGIEKKLSEILNAHKKTKLTNVFIATDCPKFFDFLGKRAPQLTFLRYTSPPKQGRNIHYNNKDFTKGENLYKTILDLYCLKNAKIFIPSRESGLSVLVNEV